jgi:hypothetical protein
MPSSLSEIQYGGQILICDLADVATIRTEPTADHSLEIPSVTVNISAEQVPNDPTYGAPYQDVENGALAYTAAFSINERLVAASVYRLFRDALINKTTLVCYATMGPGAIGPTNEEIQFEFVPGSSQFGWKPGAKRAGDYTFPIKGGSVVYNVTPVP